MWVAPKGAVRDYTHLAEQDNCTNTETRSYQKLCLLQLVRRNYIRASTSRLGLPYVYSFQAREAAESDSRMDLYPVCPSTWNLISLRSSS